MSKSLEDPLARYRKSMQWRWWVLGIAGTLIAFGFLVAERLGTYETKANAEDAATQHGTEHSELETRVKGIERRVITVRILQGRQIERAELIDTRLELLLARGHAEPRTPRERRHFAAREEALEEQIQEQETLIERLERDPRVRQAEAADPLEDLDL